jgi:hypothetical protein
MDLTSMDLTSMDLTSTDLTSMDPTSTDLTSTGNRRPHQRSTEIETVSPNPGSVQSVVP